MKYPFIGSALSCMGTRGDLPLHDAFCTTIQSRAMNNHLFVGLHEYANCMVVYDRIGIAERQQRDCAAEPAGDVRAQDAARRRAFGFVAPTRLDGKGRIAIAPWMRDRRGVAQRALLVGMGNHFEVWNLEYVLEHGPADLAMLATLQLDQTPTKDSVHAPSLQLIASRRLSAQAEKPGVRLQPVQTLSARSGLVIVDNA